MSYEDDQDTIADADRELRRMIGICQQARDDLIRWGDHTTMCELVIAGSMPAARCTCGFDAAVAAIEAAL